MESSRAQGPSQPANGSATPGPKGFDLTNHIPDKQRFRKGFPCPICGGCDDDPRGRASRCFGFLSADGLWCHCTREEHCGNAALNPGSNAWQHKLKGKCPCGVEHAPADPKPRKKIVATYPYRDAAGVELFEVVRYEPKDFRQRRRGSDGQWVWNLKGVEPVPFRLPELLAADPEEWVLVLEGERDVETGRKHGFTCTCNAGGAGKWRPAFARHFKGRRVAVIPDNDDAGREHAESVALSLASEALEIKVIALPDSPSKGDLSDYFARGGTAEDLGRLIFKAPPWSPPVGSNGKPPGTPPGPHTGDGDAPINRTDLGNARRLVRLFGDGLRYCPQWGSWLTWDGRRWLEDQNGEVYRRAKRTALSIGREAADAVDIDEGKALLRFALDTESRKRLEAMIALAWSEPGIPVDPSQLNRDPMLLNVENGTIDLATGRLRPHRQDDLITKLCPVAFDAAAECPLWEETLELVFDCNAELVAYWQRLTGYALTGATSEQVLPILHGGGENGKSTVLNVMLEILGPDYAMKAPPNLLMAKKHDGHPTELADLFGKRLVVAMETGEGTRFNEPLVKELTGSDPIRARRMREDHWQFDPTHKFMIGTNHKPQIRGTDHAIWRRIHLVPFDVRIPADRKDKSMPRKLRKEYPGILAWCVRGCLDWQRLDGLGVPPVVEQATEAYREDQDILGRFFEECCRVVPGDESVQVKARQLYQAYSQWASKGGENPMSETLFGRRVAERGFKKRPGRSCNFYLGIELSQNEDLF